MHHFQRNVRLVASSLVLGIVLVAATAPAPGQVPNFVHVDTTHSGQHRTWKEAKALAPQYTVTGYRVEPKSGGGFTLNDNQAALKDADWVVAQSIEAETTPEPAIKKIDLIVVDYSQLSAREINPKLHYIIGVVAVAVALLAGFLIGRRRR